ncbi:MAG: hypothetical protein U0992_22590 [Planctomycetaceae bacterium]
MNARAVVLLGFVVYAPTVANSQQSIDASAYGKWNSLFQTNHDQDISVLQTLSNLPDAQEEIVRSSLPYGQLMHVDVPAIAKDVTYSSADTKVVRTSY